MVTMAGEFEMEIRRAEAGDARLLAALGTVTFYEAYFEQDTPEDMANYLAEAFSEVTMTKELADPASTFFIALREGHAVGYAKLLRGEAADGVGGERPVELKRIYLVERVWGTGAGTQLLEHCMAAARAAEHDRIWLGVWEENARAIGFYRKHGFERVGTIEFPYGDSVGVNQVLERRL